MDHLTAELSAVEERSALTLVLVLVYVQLYNGFSKSIKAGYTRSIYFSKARVAVTVAFSLDRSS
jgi:hypothetical protein